MPEPSELAVVKAQLEAIKETVSDIKRAVTDLNKLTTTVAILGEQQAAHGERLVEHRKLIDKIDMSSSMNSSYLSKIRGGLSLTVTIVSVVQAAVFAGAGWLLSTVIELKQDTHALNQTVQRLAEDQQNIAKYVLKDK